MSTLRASAPNSTYVLPICSIINVNVKLMNKVSQVIQLEHDSSQFHNKRRLKMGEPRAFWLMNIYRVFSSLSALMVFSSTFYVFVSCCQPSLAVDSNQSVTAPTTGDEYENPMESNPSDRPNRPVNRFAISLSSAFEEANSKHPNIIVALKNLEIAKAEIRIAGARPNPQLAGQFGWGDAYTGVIAGNTQQVGINQLFETARKRRARLKYAKENYELAVRQLADLRFDVRSEVRRTYAEAAAAESNVTLIEDQRAVIAKFVQLAHLRARNKVAAPGEELQAQLALDQYYALERTAYTRLRQACIKLDYMFGLPLERDLDVDDNGLFRLAAEKTSLVPGPNAPIPTLEELVASAFEKRPDLLVAKQKTVVDRRALSLERRKAVPDLLLGSGLAYSTYAHNKPAVPQQFGAYMNVNVDVPILYRRQGEIAQAKSELAQSLNAIERTRTLVKRDVYLAYESLVTARHNIKLFQHHLLPDAKRVSQFAQLRYEGGKGDIGDAIVGQQAFISTMKSYFDTVVDYQNAWADLETAVGTPMIF